MWGWLGGRRGADLVREAGWKLPAAMRAGGADRAYEAGWGEGGRNRPRLMVR